MYLSGHRGVVSDYEWTPGPRVPGAASLQSIEKALSALYFTFVLCFLEECAKNAFISPSACVFVTVSYIY